MEALLSQAARDLAATVIGMAVGDFWKKLPLGDKLKVFILALMGYLWASLPDRHSW